jgi:hypothetical protein
MKLRQLAENPFKPDLNRIVWLEFVFFALLPALPEI